MKKKIILSIASFLFLATILSAQTSSITFDESEFDFGKIAQGEKVQHIFRFTNTGNEPLFLTNAKGSCGCTVPSWPKDFIEPGGTGAIVVEFDSKGKIGPQTKQVTITANTDPPQSICYIKGEVFVPSETENTGISDRKIPIQKSEPSGSNIILAYPNPASNTLSLEIKEANGQAANVEIYNSNGQLIDKLEVFKVGKSPIEFDVRNYAGGNYWFSVKVGDASRVSLPFVVVK